MLNLQQISTFTMALVKGVIEFIKNNIITSLILLFGALFIVAAIGSTFYLSFLAYGLGNLVAAIHYALVGIVCIAVLWVVSQGFEITVTD